MSEHQHISDLDFTRFQRNEMEGQELAMFKEHLLWCLPCLEIAEKNLRGTRQKKPARLQRTAAGKAAGSAA
jgi:hypothetical protein